MEDLVASCLDLGSATFKLLLYSRNKHILPCDPEHKPHTQFHDMIPLL